MPIVVPHKAVYLLVVPGFADWEPAHAVAELRRHGAYRIEVVGLTGTPVQSMGGIMVQPSSRLQDVDIGDVAVFILPGGDRWEKEPVEPEVTEFLHRLDAAGVPIAAICAGTTVVARAGLIRGRRHTSNGLGYLRDHTPGYADASSYVDEPAVRDGGLITATGLGDVEFAAAIMAELGVLDEPSRALWTNLFRSGRVPNGAAKRNLDSISPFFIVKDLQASISHYIERFGFQLDFQGPPDDVYYGHVSRDGIGIMLKAISPDVLPCPNHTRHAWARWDAYIYTEDPDPLFAEFKRRGASFVQELSFIDDGLWGFEVTDADGYVLAFFRTRNE